MMQKVRHETCEQYVARRLSEGWGIVWQRGLHLILSSPDGNILRPVDLGNDVETLRPNAVGDETALTPNTGENWAAVDEVDPDGLTTYVYGYSESYLRDLYNLPAHSGSGIINSITIYFRVRGVGGYYTYFKPSLKSDSTVTDGTEVERLDTTWVTYNQVWTTNPAPPGTDAWTWANIDALQIGVSIKGGGVNAKVTQVYVEVDYVGVSAPTVTAQAATLVEDTTATTNGNITDNGGENCDKRGVVYDTSTHADPGNVAPGASGYASYAEDTDGFGTGAFTKAISSLPPGTTIYYRMYAHNSAGYDYSNTEITFLTKPAAPTNVAATDGDHTDKVVVTWTKSTGATGYKVYEGANLLDTLGDVATYDDTAAPAPTVTPGDADASDGTSPDHVSLSLSGQSANNGASRTYKVVALNATGDSDDSDTDTGYRGVGALTYQWQRSAADSDADYSNIDGATTASYNDTGAPANGDGRYYRCVVSAEGA